MGSEACKKARRKYYEKHKKEAIERAREYYLEHREEIRAKLRRSPLHCLICNSKLPEVEGRGMRKKFCHACQSKKNVERARQWRKRNPIKTRQYSIAGQERQKSKKRSVIEHYGGCCVCCGESRYEFLTFDHVNNDGAAHRKELGSSCPTVLVRWIIENNFPDTIQILCFNCNIAKSIYGTCPHKWRDNE